MLLTIAIAADVVNLPEILFIASLPGKVPAPKVSKTLHYSQVVRRQRRPASNRSGTVWLRAEGSKEFQRKAAG
jgi:hypothetical protein